MYSESAKLPICCTGRIFLLVRVFLHFVGDVGTTDQKGNRTSKNRYSG